MDSPALRELLRPAMFVNLALWLSFTASIVIYGLVAYFAAQQSPGATEVSAALQPAFAGAALLTGLGSLLVPRLRLSDDRLRAAMEADPDPEVLARHPRLGTVDEERLRRIQSLTGLERKLLQLPPLYSAPFIIRLALNGAVAIYGLVLAFLSHSFAAILPFAGAALVLNLICLPRIEPLLDRACRLVR